MQLVARSAPCAKGGGTREWGTGGCRRASQQPARPPRRRPAQLRVEAAAALTVQPSSLTVAPVDKKLQRAQAAVLEAVRGAKGRGKSGLSPGQQAAFEAAVAALEASGRGAPAPAASPLLAGRWRLLFTTRPGTASPIQRTFTGVDTFAVYQDIEWGGGAPARVNNVVDFGAKVGFLKVEAEASTERAPLPGFTPRRGEGLPFGILGRSSTAPPAVPDVRIDFQFDRAAFTFYALPFKIPYPVPFRLLGDETKGFIDITYLSPDGRFRLARGNKGTLFVLVKELAPKERLLEALARGADDATIEALSAELAEQSSSRSSSSAAVAAPARSPLAAGRWRLLWTKQGNSANPLQQALAKNVANWQIIREGGELENLVELPLGLRVRAVAECAPEGPARTGVEINQVIFQAGPLQLPIPVKRDERGWVEWLYLDEDFRVTRGNRGSLFIHRRERE